MARADGDEDSCQPGALPRFCTSQLDRTPPPGGLDDLSPLRRAVVEAAASQIGAVADAQGTDCHKQGWQNLVDFYSLTHRKALRPFEINQLKTVGRGINSWCGIFALWAVKKGAAQIVGDQGGEDQGPPPRPARGQQADFRGTYWNWVRWVDGHGIYGIPERFTADGIQPGDVVVFKGELHHHALVERVVGDKIYTIDGNTYCQMIARKVHDLSDVIAYYSIE